MCTFAAHGVWAVPPSKTTAHHPTHPPACRAASGDAEAETLELELLRVAALHAVQHVQGALQASVK